MTTTLDTAQNGAYPTAAAQAATESHGEHGDHRLLGLMTFLASESLMFFGIFTAYLIYRASAEVWPPEGTEVELFLPAINTIILVSSSFVLHMGEVAIKKGQVQQMRLWYIATIAMGLIFLGGQVYEYTELGYGLSKNVFSSCFYVMTGFHGLHVFVGVLMMLGVLWRSRRPGHYTATKHTGVSMAEIYWHFVDIIWIILFVLLYILTLF